jgi:hypothetical protein
VAPPSTKKREKLRPKRKTKEELEAKAAKKAAKKAERRAERRAVAEAGNRRPQDRPRRETAEPAAGARAHPLVGGSRAVTKEPVYKNPMLYVLVCAAVVFAVAWMLWRRG